MNAWVQLRSKSLFSLTVGMLGPCSSKNLEYWSSVGGTNVYYFCMTTTAENGTLQVRVGRVISATLYDMMRLVDPGSSNVLLTKNKNNRM